MTIYQNNHRRNEKFTNRAFLPLIVLLFIGFLGCDETPTEIEDYDPQPVLTAFLYNGEPVDHVYLERVAPLGQYFLPSDHFISGAEIILFSLDNPSAGDTLHFVENHDSTLGYSYVPAPGENLIPQGLVHYRIEARKPSENLDLWAETIVPDTFSLTVSPYAVELDSILTPLDWNDPPIELNWTASNGTGGYIISLVAMENYPLIPLDPDMEMVDHPGTQVIEILNESANSLQIPWLIFTWVGWHWIQVQAASLDYVEYSESIFNASNADPLFNVHGGLGIFSGFSRHGFYVNLQRTN